MLSLFVYCCSHQMIALHFSATISVFLTNVFIFYSSSETCTFCIDVGFVLLHC